MVSLKRVRATYPPASDGVKTCRRCALTKDIRLFPQNSQFLDGRARWCKACTAVVSAEWRKDNPGRNAANTAKYKTQHPGKDAEWRRNNREYALKRVAAWRKANPDASKMQSRRRYANKRGVEGIFTVVEWQDLCARFDNRCVCCGCWEKLTADHIIPISKGGKGSIANIQPLCNRCNSSKGAHHCTDYRTYPWAWSLRQGAD